MISFSEVSQLQSDLKDLWEEYKTKPISFTDFIKVQQIELEDLFDKKSMARINIFKNLMTMLKNTNIGRCHTP